MKKSFLSQARTGKRNDIFEVQSFRRFWKSLQIKSGYHRRFVDGYYIECIYCTYIYTVYIYICACIPKVRAMMLLVLLHPKSPSLDK